MLKKSYTLIIIITVTFNSFAQSNIQQYDSDLLSPAFHKQRREALRQQLPNNSVAIFFSAPERNRSNDVDFLYHQNPDLYYLTGYTEPNAVLLIFKNTQTIDSTTSNEFIFVQPRKPKAELWTGRRLGKEGVEKKLGLKGVLINSDFSEVKIEYSKLDSVFLNTLPEGLVDDEKDKGALYKLLSVWEEKTKKLGKHIDTKKVPQVMAKLRQQKQSEELVLMKKAINASCKGITEIMKALEPNMFEYQAQAIAECVFKMNGSEYLGYPSIVGGGENSCILHYESNRKILLNGEMLVADVGAEYHGYSADITRTLPVNGKFSAEQKAIYNLVLKAQAAGFEACKKGNSFHAPDKAAREIITKGLKELGIVKDDIQAYIYFPHGTSHYLGLDVHDAGTYNNLNSGDVITVEPGIYIPSGSDCDPKWWNIGVRIEDDVLITEKGYEILSDCVPRTVENIEHTMQQHSIFNDLK